jgi:hypothetical protein
MQSSASVRFCRYEVVVTDELDALAEFSGGECHPRSSFAAAPS